MNKKLSAFLACILCLAPLPVMADNPHGQFSTVGNYAFTGYITAINLNPVFMNKVGGTSALSFGFLSSAYNYEIETNQSLLALATNPQPGFLALIGIKGFSISCLPWNPSLVGAPGNPYNTPETNGVGGGTVTIHEYKPTGAAVIVGTVVLPTSPHNGPYVNTATSVLHEPYAPTAGSVFDAQVTFADLVPSQAYQQCDVTAVLQ